MFLITTSDSEHLTSFLSCLECLFSTNVIFMACTENDENALRCCDTFSHFTLKVEETRSVDYIKLAVFPLDGSKSCCNGNVASLLFGIEVKSCVSFFNTTQSVCKTCDIKHSLCKSCFTSSCMTCESDITNVFSVIVFQNNSSLFIIERQVVFAVVFVLKIILLTNASCCYYITYQQKKQ